VLPFEKATPHSPNRREFQCNPILDSRNEPTGKTEFKRVLHTTVRAAPAVWRSHPADAKTKQEETHLELNLSQGGDPFDETLIVPASKMSLLTNGLSKPARQLKAGDRIAMTGGHIALVKKAETRIYTLPLSQEPDIQGNVMGRVLGTTKRLTNRLLYLYTQDELIKTTPEHPFAVAGKGWVPAGRLQHGDRIQSAAGRLITVEHIQVRQERQMVYNLRVEGTHTFFVGRNKLLVHNGGDCVPELPDLQFAHSEETIRKSSGYPYWSKQSTPDIIDSLKPGAESPLTVYPDGIIADGNTRIRILIDRRVDVNNLPRVPHNRISFPEP